MQELDLNLYLLTDSKQKCHTVPVHEAEVIHTYSPVFGHEVTATLSVLETKKLRNHVFANGEFSFGGRVYTLIEAETHGTGMISVLRLYGGVS